MAARAEAVDRSDSEDHEAHRLEENIAAVEIELTPDDLREIDRATMQINKQLTGR